MANPIPEIAMSKTYPTRLAVRTPWSEACIAELKACIPWTRRQWDKGEKAWLVGTDFLAECRRICTKHFGAVLLSKDVEQLAQEDEDEFPKERSGEQDSGNAWWS